MKNRDMSENRQQNKFVISSKEEISFISNEQYLKMLEEGIIEENEATNDGGD